MGEGERKEEREKGWLEERLDTTIDRAKQLSSSHYYYYYAQLLVYVLAQEGVRLRRLRGKEIRFLPSLSQDYRFCSASHLNTTKR